MNFKELEEEFTQKCMESVREFIKFVDFKGSIKITTEFTGSDFLKKIYVLQLIREDNTPLYQINVHLFNSFNGDRENVHVVNRSNDATLVIYDELKNKPELP